MTKQDFDIKKILIISVLISLAAIGGIIFYFNNRLSSLDEGFNTKLLILNREILENINSLQQNVEAELSSLRNNLTLDIETLDKSLTSFRKKNEQEIVTLNLLIDEIEKQSDIKLQELKEEISTIQVKSTDFSVIVDEVIKSVVSVGTNKGQGSGAIIDNSGFIVTNYHVVEGASIIRVMTYDSKIYDAALIGYNDVPDVAVLKVNANLQSLGFGNSNDVKTGERVIALGNPAGLSFTVTEGIVSAVHRAGPNGLNIYTQTDVPINPGNSGGPLVDVNSRIIGINNFKIGGFEGLGFAIESNAVEQVTDEIISSYLSQAQK